MYNFTTELTRAQISRAAIERLYIAMRHLFIRGSYKPLGVSGEAMIQSLLELNPEIYGSIGDPEKVELNGLLYIFQRLPEGIEACRYVRLISREGYESSEYNSIIPLKRRRNCYRIDEDQMLIEMVRGKSDIYDVLTHLTFMYIEAEKIRKNILDHKNRQSREWRKLKRIIKKINEDKSFKKELGYSYLSTILSRTYEETAEAAEKFEKSRKVNSLFNIVYWLGTISIDEYLNENDREITFSLTLREKIGHHIFGNLWAHNIKKNLDKLDLLKRPIHIISSNLHSVMNSLYALPAIGEELNVKKLETLAKKLSKDSSEKFRSKVKDFALKNGMIEIADNMGVNIGVQLFDSKRVSQITEFNDDANHKNDYVLIVMDYAFGEQAYELMDELLKPYEKNDRKIPLNIKSINIMGKAGILEGSKGDIMLPTAHIFEGSADNYPLKNKIKAKSFEKSGLKVFEGPMVTVLGTSLQNKDILRYFHRSSWQAIGLEMEGAHYQKAIQSASKIRNSIGRNVDIRYAYYASDNPLETGSTLASGGLGIDGVKSTYVITKTILQSIMNPKTKNRS